MADTEEPLKKKRGRKTYPEFIPTPEEKYKPEFCDLLIKHMSAGLSFDTFGTTIDVVRSTLYDWKHRHPEFLLAHKKGIDARLLRDERLLEQFNDGSLKGNATTLIFKFKALHRITDDVVGMEKLRLLKLEGMSDKDIKELAKNFLSEKNS